MKHKTIALLGAALAIGSAQAATISIAGSNTTSSITAGGGGASISNSLSAVDGPAPQDIAYTISGLDLNGTADDEVIVTFTVTTDGQNINVAGSGNFTLSSGGVTLNANGEFVQMTISSVVVNVDGGSNNGIGSFNGFSSVQFGNWADGLDAATLNGSQVVATGSNQTFGVTGNTWKAEFDTTPDGTVDIGEWRVIGWNFSVDADAVPEPSSTLLIGLGSLALMRRRRR